MQILVTGAAGQVGRQVIAALKARGMRPRALVRRPEQAVRLEGTEVRQGDFEDPRSLDAALEGIERVFLVCTPTARLPELERNVISAAARARVELVVKGSLLGAEAGPIAFRAIHAESEAALAASGLPFAVLRPNYFMQNTLQVAPAVAESGRYEDAAGGARLSMVDLRDVGEAAAAVLTGPDHAGKTYHLTGAEALSGADVARLFSAALGRDVQVMDLDPAEQHRRLAGYGLPAWVNDAIADLYRDYRRSGATGYAAVLRDDVYRLTGHLPRTLRSLLGETFSPKAPRP
jgi:uncharacterized protein YbjT (DUF2867 family)